MDRMKPHWLALSREARRALMGAAVGWAFAAPLTAQTADRVLAVHGVDRTYRLHVPRGLPRDGTAALVLAFHGGGGDGAGMERLTGFSALADRVGFAVAYPDGIARHWNDGRDSSASEAHRRRVDDLGFIAALIDTLVAELNGDPKRVFATGISNGAIFAHYLAAHLAGRVAAIATVAGSIAQPFAQEFAPSAPVAVFMIQGTDDPLVPYSGGGVAPGRHGRVIGRDFDATIAIWDFFSRHARAGGPGGTR